MKTLWRMLVLILIGSLATSCDGVVSFGGGSRSITPSNVTITETRDVGSFTGIDIRTFGAVVVTLGEAESLAITGRDNLVPLIDASVRDGTLVVEMEESVNVLSADRGDLLTFDITVQELDALTVSGLASVEMDALSTTSLDVTVSGAGTVRMHQLAAKRLDILLSGIGNVEATGEAVHATIQISGAGEVRAGDLQCQTADVSVPGLGSATVWVTDALSGKISGGGNVSYYGDPQTDTQTTGLGSFKALGDK
jgi:hypothetical protein